MNNFDLFSRNKKNEYVDPKPVGTSKKFTYTDAYNLDLIDDATEALLVWLLGINLGGLPAGGGVDSWGGGVMGLFLSGGNWAGGSKSLRLM